VKSKVENTKKKGKTQIKSKTQIKKQNANKKVKRKQKSKTQIKSNASNEAERDLGSQASCCCNTKYISGCSGKWTELRDLLVFHGDFLGSQE